MKFKELKILIKKESLSGEFVQASEKIQKIIFDLNKKQIIPLLDEIGTIPEDIAHDSTEEKLFSKVTDILLSKSLQEMGLSSTVIRERANCADVIAKSKFHNYSLVGDAKAFRLSRTAKNQKDFKVKSMVDWREDNDYSVLVCPYFQYPKVNSQIYGQALDGNVCLLSWEHLALFLEMGIHESEKLNLSTIWDISSHLAELVTVKDKNKNVNFQDAGNGIICSVLEINHDELERKFLKSKKDIIFRGEKEIEYWENNMEMIKKYSKEEAIKKLLDALKINEKISAIQKYVNSLKE